MCTARRKLSGYSVALRAKKVHEAFTIRKHMVKCVTGSWAGIDSGIFLGMVRSTVLCLLHGSLAETALCCYLQ